MKEKILLTVSLAVMIALTITATSITPNMAFAIENYLQLRSATVTENGNIDVDIRTGDNIPSEKGNSGFGYAVLTDVGDEFVNNVLVAITDIGLDDYDESKNDKLTLNLGNDRYKIDPLTVNMICNYSNNSSLNNIITKSVAYENDPSFLHKSCNSFKNTYHKLSGIFDNVNNLTITSEKPHLKILFKKDLLSEEIKGYISDEFKGIGIITVHSVSLSCSFTPFDQLMLLPKER